MIWAGILLALWIGLVAYHETRPRFNYERTGDELFDRTALWVLEQRALLHREPSPLQMWLYQNTDFYELPEYTVDFKPLSWEKGFGDDPRYWQLLKQLGTIHRYIDMEDSPEFSWPLRFEEPVSDAEYVSRLSTVPVNDASYAVLTFRPGIIDIGPSVSKGEQELELLQELVDTAIALNPDNAYYYYEKADLLLQLGEWETAWELVRKGNIASENYVPAVFPLDALQDNMDHFTTEDSLIAASILQISGHERNYIRWKERYKEVCCMMAWGAPIELADDYIIRARCQAKAVAGKTGNQVMVSQVLAGLLLEYLCEYCLELNQEQQLELAVILRDLEAAETHIDNALAVYFPPGVEPPFLASSAFLHKEMGAGTWEVICAENEAAEEVKPYFDILDPPPFAIWARGELIGLDTSGVVLQEQ